MPDDHFRLCRVRNDIFKFQFIFDIDSVQLGIESRRRSNRHESLQAVANSTGFELKRSISILKGEFQGFSCMLENQIILHLQASTSIEVLLAGVVFVVLLANSCSHFFFSFCQWIFMSIDLICYAKKTEKNHQQNNLSNSTINNIETKIEIVGSVVCAYLCIIFLCKSVVCVCVLLIIWLVQRINRT